MYLAVEAYVMYIAYECIIYLDVRDTSSYSNDMRHASCMPYIRDMTHVCHITAYTSKYVRDTSKYSNDMDLCVCVCVVVCMYREDLLV